MIGSPDWLYRVVQLLIALATLVCVANGVFMLWDPLAWYQMIETVKFTGPPNSHFIRDIGLAYFMCAVLLGFGLVRPSMRWLAVMAGGLWLSFHGGLHIWEVLTGGCTTEVFWQDAPAVLGPPLLVWVALGIMFVRQRIAPAGVPNLLYMRVMEQTTHGEGAYIREIEAAPGGALEKFKHFQSATFHRHAAPADLFHMARIGATLVEDCTARWY
jgi:uncharacterized protein YjeT (DUF2065 family)